MFSLLLAATVAMAGVQATPESQGVSSRAVLKWVDACEKTLDDIHGFVLRRHGKVIAEGSWKPYDTLNETHMLYSHSKSFTAVAVGFLVDDGKLDIDERVIEIFPDKTPEKPSENLRQMRVRDLLTMNVGADFSDAEKKDISGDWVKLFLHNEIQHRPGTRFKYDSCATHVLAAIVERRSGKGLMAFLDDRLFRHLGIAKAWSTTSPQGVACGGWGMNMTTRELSLFGQFCMNDGVWEGKRLLSKEWLDLCRSRQTWSSKIVVNAQTLGQGKDWDQGYGFQFWRCRHNAWRCDGAYGQYTIGMPDQEATISIHAGVGDMCAEIQLVWDILLPAFGKGPLPEDPEASAELATRCRSLALPTVAGTREGADAVFGRAFKIEGETRHHFKSFHVDRADNGWTCTFGTASGEQRVPVGYGEWQDGRAAFDPLRYEGLMELVDEQPVRSSGAVQADGSFKMRLRLTGTTGLVDLTLRPDGTLAGRVWSIGGYNFKGRN